MQRHDFAYELPPELIAQSPLAERSASRLLVLSNAADGTANAKLLGAMSNNRGAPPAPAAASSDKAIARPEHVSGGPGVDPAHMRGISNAHFAGIRDSTMRNFPELLRPGDLLVFNDTKVVAARLVGMKPSGGRVEIFLERVVDVNQAAVQLRASKPIREGLEVRTAGGVVRILGRQGDLWRVEFPGPALEFFEQWGDVPLPPYIHRATDANDRERYQSIFARERGAVAAPTASLHFDSQLIREIEARGVKRAFVTLHVGAGTFQPVRTDDLALHVMHAERVTVSAATCEAIERTRAEGGRIVAIGTTVVRALESAALAARGLGVGTASLPTGAPEMYGHPTRTTGLTADARGVNTEGAGRQTEGRGSSADGDKVGCGEADGPPISVHGLAQDARGLAQGASAAARVIPAASRDSHAVVDRAPRAADRTPATEDVLPTAAQVLPASGWSGETRLFITPGFNFRVVDALLTNFHLPESTLLMLVCAFAGKDAVLAAYEHAVRAQYRFFSYGDAMFLNRARVDG